ncbi:MAG: hypothetical protein M3092_07155 [Actinomycetia bacterium]|nr:hypothetical protein [Actinomycetes bacterium]
MGEHDRSRVVLIAIGVVVAVLVGVAVVIAIQPPAVLDPTTPEGTAQGYFQALHDGDDTLLTSYLTDDLKDRCDALAYLEDFGRYEQRETTGVSITSTEIEGDTARVEITITVTYGDGPFAAGSDTFDETLVIEHQGDRWLIAEPAWPWDRYSCEREG